MNRAEFLDAVRDENQTELSRLGSSKSLYALTGGEMDENDVYAVVQTLAGELAATFESWSGDADGALATALSAAVETERERAADAAEETDADTDAEGGLYDALDGLKSPVERAAGLVAATLVGKKVQEQLVGFFVGQADPTTASTFRDYGGVLEDRREAALDALESVVDGDDDWETAVETAERVVGGAYEVYTDRLEAMGVNPKPVC
ncbi:rubrerythrin family protein [Haloarchaeobius sp. HRN-SO-5]|uniref:rubrerythrin family protein n=1 Tax=Haloarchaeobius sp. HRN-SO-5 TaxID=3446118 RepID=UPI003EBCBD51